ncbi:MAG TPA: hypothetical protein VEO74_10135 [Thermoanaerobaculia bacterium]|nr:hypothetical protein [Thermoanaerobaculia bacterium]
MIPELLALLVVAVTGAALAPALDRHARGSLVAGEALLLGIGAGAAALLALSLLYVSWSRGVCVTAMLMIAAISSFAWRRRDPFTSRGDLRISIPLLALAVVLVGGYLMLATIAPIWEFDFIADWGFKARAFFVARGVDWSFLEHPLHRDIHPDYPPLLTLAFDLLAIARGAWNDQAMGLISVAFGVALLLVIHRMALEETQSRTIAAFLTVAMVPLACSPWIGLGEGPLVAYGTTALLLIRRGSVTPGAVMLGLAASTKNEGLTLIAATAGGLFVAKRLREIPRLWPAVAIPLPWLVLRHVHHLQTDLTEGNVVARIVEHLGNPKPLLDAFATYSVGKPFFWLALAVGVVFTLRPLLARERFLLVAIVVQFVFYIVAYLATPHDVLWHVRWSWERLISHLAPALTYIVLVHLLDNHA